MIKFTVYKILNLITDEYYIGVHKTSNVNDSYLGSGIHIKNQVKKYGKDNFKKEILFEFDEEKDAYEKEIQLINENINNTLCLNIGPGGIGGSKFKGRHHTIETKLKNKLQSTGRVWIHNEIESRFPKKEDLKYYLDNGWKIGKHKKDCKVGRKAWNKGLKYSDNRLFNEEHKRKISQSLKSYYKNRSDKLGYKHSEESRKKMSQNSYLHKYGMSEEEKEKRRIKMKEIWKKRKNCGTE